MTMWPFRTKYPEHKPEEVNGKEYDFVVVGASRLSEDPKVSVLLIERGPLNDSWMSRIPLLSTDIFNPSTGAVLPYFIKSEKHVHQYWQKWRGISAVVSRLTFVMEDGRPRPDEVLLRHSDSKSEVVYSVKVKKEVIVCSGTFGSPPLLMRSGIGPRKHLEEHKIVVVRDLEGVGFNLVCSIVKITTGFRL
ncbi:putative Choline dehydrogenase [Glarea lozoyensis 74030]|uniref:Putative Choline dehydrogenase n=1 Tax=Glarea lozoyensis (strain ATCC 74030 / MF5533) TaxID=1104152 RepID=H0EXB2_GLAL7|nr:putative Choline dehydrogenase [Glarea lozoyensis 74030]